MSGVLTKIRKALKKKRVKLFRIDDFNAAKKKHLRNITLPNGKFMILPIDQGLEHGPTDFLVNPDCGDPEYQLRLAKEGGYSAIALQIGLAKKYWSKPEYKKYVPLVLKLNGKTCIPGDDRPFSPLNSSVEEAEKLGADAVGYTLYVGSARQDEDFLQFRQVRQEAAKYDIPVIVWAYPRGEQINANGGKNSLAAVDYAVRAAMELGADVVKFNWPEFPKNGFAKGSCFEEYNTLSDLNRKERLTKVVQTAGALGAILSGGSRVSDKELLEHVRTAMEVGMDGIIFGRNEWQREYKSALLMSTKIREILLA